MSETPHRIEFALRTPETCLFGWGCRSPIPEQIVRQYERLFLVTGHTTRQRSPLVNDYLDELSAAGVRVIPVGTSLGEPTDVQVDALRQALSAHEPTDRDGVLAIGGGSTLDLGKAVAGLARESMDTPTRDYLEGVGRGVTPSTAPLRLIAMPTTAGTGTEATKNAVISGSGPAFKKSLRHPKLVPAVAIVDPELSADAPRSVFAASGMDALTQNIESYISCRSTPLTAPLALEGAASAFHALTRLVEDSGDRSARSRLALAAFQSGVALANSGLGMAHGVAAALGIHCGVPHGVACAVLLPIALEANLEVAEERLTDLAAATIGERDPARFVLAVRMLSEALGIPTSLSDLGVTADHLPAVVAGSRGNSMSGNPRVIDDQELTALLEANL